VMGAAGAVIEPDDLNFPPTGKNDAMNRVIAGFIFHRASDT
jgi:hypothetical protein